MTQFYFAASIGNLMHIRIILMCFGIVTRLQVDLSKSELVLMGEVDNVAFLVYLLCCKVRFTPMVYLGVPFGSARKIKSVTV